MKIDRFKGEWRCGCPEDDSFDKSANPVFVSRCLTCGVSRPIDTKEWTLMDYIRDYVRRLLK
jgi:hypothetical protein